MLDKIKHAAVVLYRVKAHP